MKLIVFVALLGALVFGQASGNEPLNAVADPIDTIFLARDNGEGKPGEETTTFRPNDVPIYCVITLNGYYLADVRMNLVAVRVGGVKPETKVVSASYKTKAGQNRVIFTGRPSGLWERGSYRIDISIDGKKLRSIPFTVVEASDQQSFAPRPLRPKHRG
ncbi:MAG: hypothetical protein C4325_04195, partial [Blastocatellia bacterium]